MNNTYPQRSPLTEQDIRDLAERLSAITAEYQRDGQMLREQGYVSEVDGRKMVADFETTKSALLDVIRNTSFPDDVRDSLIDSFMSDYNVRLERLLASAIARQSPLRAIDYLLDKADAKLNSSLTELRANGRLSVYAEYEIRGFMRGARMFIPRTQLPATGFFRNQPSIPFELLKQYAEQVSMLVEQRKNETLPSA